MLKVVFKIKTSYNIEQDTLFETGFPLLRRTNTDTRFFKLRISHTIDEQNHDWPLRAIVSTRNQTIHLESRACWIVVWCRDCNQLPCYSRTINSPNAVCLRRWPNRMHVRSTVTMLIKTLGFSARYWNDLPTYSVVESYPANHKKCKGTHGWRSKPRTFLHEKLTPILCIAYRLTTSRMRPYSSLRFLKAFLRAATL